MTAEIVYVGHATVLIEMDGVRLLTDPVLGEWLGPLRRQVPAAPREHAERL
ncbi:MAG: MBL fold metallo-hydrolase, partial [Actinobacteria bacterium]|nr:MBL fold metallo-hydrolase [Actinomycetota bacterium]